MKRLIVPLAIALLLTANLFVGSRAFAHQLGNWHWDRYGSSVTVQVYNTATYASEASAAINDWSNNTILYVPQVNYHTDISVFDGNYGDTSWAGLAEFVSFTGDHITHGHARLNYYYSMDSNYTKGVFCHEVGHMFGLDHANTGSCMGLGYFAGSGYTTISHDWDDIYNMYRYTHH